jgi:hypothetical protein
MTLHVPVWLQPAGGDSAINYSAQEARQYNRALLTSSTGVGGQQGVLTFSNLNVVQRGAGANLSVDVPAGLGFVVGDDTTNQGTYQVWNDATVNVPTPNPPGSGTQVHRLVLQVQDKLNNGVWAGYQAAFTVLADTGSGTPAEPNSAITLALISISSVQSSVQNAQITDYRQRVGPIGVLKSSDTSNAGTSLADDPHLQLLNLQANTKYSFDAQIMYSGGTGGNESDLTFKFRTAGISYSHLNRLNYNLSGALVWNTQAIGDTITNCQTIGTTNPDSPLLIGGDVETGNAPCWAIMQFAQTNSSGTFTWLRQGSRITMRPMG